MTRFFTIAAAAMLAACIGTNSWSQGGQSGGGGTSGGAGASGSAGASGASGSAGAGGTSTAGSAGTSTAGQAGTNSAGQGGTTAAGQAGTTAAGQSGTTAGGQGGTSAPGQLGTGPRNPSNVPGQRQFGNAQQPGANFNGPSRNPWFADQGARQQLNLNDNQFNNLNRAYQDSWNRYNQGATNLGNLDEQQRLQQMQQLEGRFQQEFGQEVESTFTDPRVRQRYNQLNNQFQGFDSFNDRNVRQQLNLTPEQQRQIRRLSTAWRQRMQQLRRAGNDNQQLTNEQWAQLQAQNMQQINSVLTPQQQQSWTQLTGEPYNFPPTSYFGDRGDAPTHNNSRVPDTSILRGGTAQRPQTQGAAGAQSQGAAGTQTQPAQGGQSQGTPSSQGGQTQGAGQGSQGTLR